MIFELYEDIDKGRVIPLTTFKNLQSILEQLAVEYEDYDTLLQDLIEFNYVKMVRDKNSQH